MNERKKNSNQQTCLILFKWRDHVLFNEQKNIIHGFIESGAPHQMHTTVV